MGHGKMMYINIVALFVRNIKQKQLKQFTSDDSWMIHKICHFIPSDTISIHKILDANLLVGYEFKELIVWTHIRG